MSRELTPEATVSRRRLLGLGTTGAVLGAVGMTIPAVALKASASGAPAQSVTGPEGAQVGLIYQLQAAFHRAKTTQDIELMMSLWADGATLNVQGDSNSPDTGGDRLPGLLAGPRLLHSPAILIGPLLQDSDQGHRRYGLALLRVPRLRRL